MRLGDCVKVVCYLCFGTGVTVADRRVFAALQEGVEEPVLFVIPKEREGLISTQDWGSQIACH